MRFTEENLKDIASVAKKSVQHGPKSGWLTVHRGKRGQISQKISNIPAKYNNSDNNIIGV